MCYIHQQHCWYSHPLLDSHMDDWMSTLVLAHGLGSGWEYNRRKGWRTVSMWAICGSVIRASRSRCRSTAAYLDIILRNKFTFHILSPSRSSYSRRMTAINNSTQVHIWIVWTTSIHCTTNGIHLETFDSLIWYWVNGRNGNIPVEHTWRSVRVYASCLRMLSRPGDNWDMGNINWMFLPVY